MSIMVYDVKSDGELAELPGFSKDLLSSDRVLIVVAERQRKIYLWKGKRSSVKQKFAGARKASALRAEWGLVFKVVAMDEGEEDNEFLSLLGTRVEAPSKPAAISSPEIEMKKPTPPPIVEEPVVEEPHPVREVQLTVQPVRTVGHSVPPSKETPRVSPATYSSGRASAGSVVSEVDEDRVISKLNEVEVPSGYTREIVIVGPFIYAVKETRTSIFGKESVERRLERVNPPEGVFVVENFLPRVISEGGRIVAIEFLREKKDEGEGMELLKSEMVKHLEDIISAFKNR